MFLDNLRQGSIIFISAHGQAIIWIPARVADAQPAGVIPDAVAGDGDAENRVGPHKQLEKALKILRCLKKYLLTHSPTHLFSMPCSLPVRGMDIVMCF